MENYAFTPQNLTVMVVDDQDPIRKGIKRVLIGMGFGEVVECFDGDDALKILTKKPVDLLILDLYMRNVSGFAVLAHVRNRDVGCDIPVIVVTGEGSKEEIVKVADLGAEDYVLKPFQATDLEKKVIKTLNKFYSPTPLVKTLRRAERHYLAKEFDKAKSSFDAAIALDGESARAAHGMALTLGRLGREEEALSILQSSIIRNQSYHKSHGAMADLFVKKKSHRDAIDAMRRELEINPKQPDRQVQLAKLLLKEGDALGAVEHYRVALLAEPKRLSALMGMGHAFAMADNIDKALYYFRRVRRYHPTQTKALEAAVRIGIAGNEPKKSEMFLREEKAQHPDRTDTFIVLAMFYLRQERDDEALALVQDLLAREPANGQGLRLKATLYLRKKDFPNAALTLLAAAKVEPSAEIFAALGNAFLGMAKIPEAMDALHKALALNPDHPQAVLSLATAHGKSQQWVKAFYLYKRALMLGASKDKCAAEARECAAQIQLRRRPRAAS